MKRKLPEGQIPTLNDLASVMVGDGLKPDVYFVTDGGNVVTVTTDARLAYHHWTNLAQRRPLQECALEDRLIGVIACVEPEEDEPNSPLGVFDHSSMVKELRS